MNDNRKEIIDLLRSTQRTGIENVIAWLDTDPSFYVASGARIHHDNVIGGLAAHSLRKVVTKRSRPNIPSRASSSRPYCTMSARKTFILSMLMAIRHGMRKTTAKGMVFVPYTCLKNWA